MARCFAVLFKAQLLSLCVANAAVCQTASQPASLNSRQAREGLAVSLREFDPNQGISEATSLFGATRLLGFLVTDDERGPDCILIFAKEGGPNLNLDDLAIAYRNVADSRAPPACTIDPQVEVLRRLTKVSQDISLTEDPERKEQLLRQWEQIGKSPQKVRVFNIDPMTHFASTMVEADYDLKSICNGAVEAAGITSLTDRFAAQIKHEIAKGKNGASIGGQNRFWFNPGRIAYRTDGHLFLLSSCEIDLLTEHEAIAADGKRIASSRGDPLAEKFARELTKRFEPLCQARPIYRELENLYRAMAVMNLLVDESRKEKKLRSILEQALGAIKIQSVPYRVTLPGRVAVDTIHIQISNGTQEIWLPSCGGVSIAIHNRMMKKEPGGFQVGLAANRIAGHRPNSATVYWEIPL